jgi:hypothetical protein
MRGIFWAHRRLRNRLPLSRLVSIIFIAGVVGLREILSIVAG